MSDIVERLRNTNSVGSWSACDYQRVEAADTIESLRQRVKELEGMLDECHNKLEAVLDSTETQYLTAEDREKRQSALNARLKQALDAMPIVKS